MQVHGGTTENDVTKFISCAERHAGENRKHKLDTVVFFDEANTTDAIGLISEIMCDRTMHGKEISKELKFIAACNPYRRCGLISNIYKICIHTKIHIVIK